MQVGLDVIKRRGTVLQCHRDMAEMVTLSEIGMSIAVLEAGYNLDCLMLRYQVGDRVFRLRVMTSLCQLWRCRFST